MTKMINCRKQRNNGPNSLQQTRFSTHHNSTITDNHPSDTTPPPPIQGALYRSSGPFSKASKKARDRVPELMPPDSSTSFPMLRRRVRPVTHNHAIGRLIYLLLLIEHRRVVALSLDRCSWLASAHFPLVRIPARHFAQKHRTQRSSKDNDASVSLKRAPVKKGLQAQKDLIIFRRKKAAPIKRCLFKSSLPSKI